MLALRLAPPLSQRAEDVRALQVAQADYQRAKRTGVDLDKARYSITDEE